MPSGYTTEKFIEKAKAKHGDKYDFGNIKYTGSRDQVLVLCSIHGEFSIVASRLLAGSGCQTCAREESKCNQTYTTETFIAKAKEKHGDNVYDYSETVYVFSKDKLTVKCSKHGRFEVNASLHLCGQGCPCCGREKSTSCRPRAPGLDTESFIIEARSKHGDRYDYSKVVYKNRSTKLIVGCSTHGDFETIPSSHLNGTGCERCGRQQAALSRMKTLAQFIRQANQVHNNLYDYSKSIYRGTDRPIIILCTIHGEFEQLPSHHIKQGSGCPRCGGTHALNTEEWLAAARQLHGNKYDYSKVIYSKAHEQVTIGCQKHGEFQQVAYKHIKGNDCPACTQEATVSKAQILWLDWMAVRMNVYIQHGGNTGEMTIPGSRYRADGYITDTMTVLEFNGSFWHGEPRLYEASAVNSVVGKTYGDLYEATLKKEEFLLAAGYHIITMWELDWRIIIRKIILLQRAWRSAMKAKKQRMS